MEAIGHYFDVELLIIITLHKAVFLTCKSGIVTLVCGHLNESYQAVLSRGTVYYAIQCGSSLFVDETLVRDH